MLDLIETGMWFQRTRCWLSRNTGIPAGKPRCKDEVKTSGQGLWKLRAFWWEVLWQWGTVVCSLKVFLKAAYIGICFILLPHVFIANSNSKNKVCKHPMQYVHVQKIPSFSNGILTLLSKINFLNSILSLLKLCSWAQWTTHKSKIKRKPYVYISCFTCFRDIVSTKNFVF